MWAKALAKLSVTARGHIRNAAATPCRDNLVGRAALADGAGAGNISERTICHRNTNIAGHHWWDDRRLLKVRLSRFAVNVRVTASAAAA